MWHCPHCGAPQAETARCWVCRRSSTTCSTCRHFRPALAADLGYCALDRHRRPLTGRELRGCWQERPGAAAGPPGPSPLAGLEPHRLRSAAASASHAASAGAGSVPAQARGFVPIELLGRLPPAAGLPAGPPDGQGNGDTGHPPAPAPVPFIPADPDEDWTDRTSLFGDGVR